MPAIEFRVADFTPTYNAHNFVLQAVQPALLQMELTAEDLRRIVIADNEHYGPAIMEISPKDGYTDDGIYQGIGKVLPRVRDTIYAGSDLVIHMCVIGSFTGSNSDGPRGEADAVGHAIYHELGHCVDYRRRPAQHAGKPPINTASVVLRCAEGNSATLLSEYAACFFSATFLTPAGFEFLADSTAKNAKQYFGALAQKRDRYRLGHLDLSVVRAAAIEAFWRCMIEHAKLYAYLHGNPALVSGEQLSLPWLGCSQEGGNTIQTMASALRKAWTSYPDCADVFEKSLTETWFALSEAEGYRFEVKPEGDYLWLV